MIATKVYNFNFKNKPVLLVQYALYNSVAYINNHVHTLKDIHKLRLQNEQIQTVERN